METAMNDPRNRGYHVVVVGGQLFRAKTGEGASKILDEVRKKYPGEVPAITYLPKTDSLILWF